MELGWKFHPGGGGLTEAKFPGTALPAKRPLLRAAASFESAGLYPKSTFRRKRVVSVTVSFPELTLPVVNEQFRAVIDRDVASGVNRLALRHVNGRGPLVALALDSPDVPMRNDMLVLLRHSR